jgi:hypothetical protein
MLKALSANLRCVWICGTLIGSGDGHVTPNKLLWRPYTAGHTRAVEKKANLKYAKFQTLFNQQQKCSQSLLVLDLNGSNQYCEVSGVAGILFLYD